MKIRFNSGQINILCNFLSNMSVAWFIAALISPRSFQYILSYIAYGSVSLYAALYLKGGRYEF